MKAIIFGASGQDGFYLEKLLVQNKIETISVSRSGADYIMKGDIADRDFVELLIQKIQPNYIFNFAANSSTRHDYLFENHSTISTGTLNILEAAIKHSKESKIFLCGSGLQFVNNGVGITETDAFEARDAYSISRIQSVYAARYFRRLGLRVYIGYLFNHDSPLRSSRHVNQKIAQAAISISTGSAEYLELGNLEVKKEFSFAGDIVEAIWKLVNNDKEIFEAVVGSGKAYSIQHWVELCFNFYGLKWKDYVILKDGFTPEYDILVSKPDTMFSLGWRPKVSIEELSKMFCQGI